MVIRYRCKFQTRVTVHYVSEKQGCPAGKLKDKSDKPNEVRSIKWAIISRATAAKVIAGWRILQYFCKCTITPIGESRDTKFLVKPTAKEKKYCHYYFNKPPCAKRANTVVQKVK
jgi:hypothetical protein